MSTPLLYDLYSDLPFSYDFVVKTLHLFSEILLTRISCTIELYYDDFTAILVTNYAI